MAASIEQAGKLLISGKIGRPPMLDDEPLVEITTVTDVVEALARITALS